MSKKTKQTKQKEIQEIKLQDENGLLEKDKNVEESMEQKQKFHCAESAEMLISGYSIRWLPSLKEFAKQNAMDGEFTLDEWKELYIKWGAKIK